MALFSVDEDGNPEYEHDPRENPDKWPDVEVVMRGATTYHPLKGDGNKFVQVMFGTSKKVSYLTSPPGLYSPTFSVF